jgi:sugar phosphate isomerase/epimerase
MTDWKHVRRELREAGYSGFEFESGETAVPGLAGEWLAGDIAREGRLKRENQPLLTRILDALPGGGGAVATDPEYAPESIREIANQHGLEVVIISVSKDEARIAVCDSSELAD